MWLSWLCNQNYQTSRDSFCSNCASGIENAVKTALRDSGKFIPWNVVTIATDGSILERV